MIEFALYSRSDIKHLCYGVGYNIQVKETNKDQKLHIASIFYTEDYNWAIKWILWLRLKENGEFGFKFLLKMTFLKYFINPLFLRSNTPPNENNFSQFAYIVKKVSQTKGAISEN